MSTCFRSYLRILVAVVLLASLFVAGAEAQKKKRSRRAKKPAAAKPVITNPEIAPPTTTDGDIKIISTAEQGTIEGERSSDSDQTKKTDASTAPSEDMQKTIKNLSTQVNRLNEKLSEMQDDDRYQLDMERLTRAEQRAEQIRSQLVDTQGRIADLEARREQMEYALKPENIERATQGSGSVHPEEARDARKHQLENEKSRLEAQLKILETSKNRLEQSQANADAEVDNLRAKLEQRRAQMEATPTSTTTTEGRPRKP